MIRLLGVSYAYRPGEPVLDGADLEVPPGLTLLVGPNGCGKSTLLKLAAGVERPDRGTIEVGEPGLWRDLWRDEAAARAGLAYVPEQPDLTPYASVGEVLRLVCRLRGEPEASAAAALAFVGLTGLAGRSVRELSMGQRRKAVLAAALVGTPSHLLLDEPLEAMDRGARDDVLAWIDRLLAAGAAVLVVSHELEPFVQRAARAVTVTAGRCAVFDPLPGDPAERLALLERLARGMPPGAPPLG
ncbi:MAG TPA: ABC transporter ATP-binding protein [Thermoanaerobaculia bacterium]